MLVIIAEGHGETIHFDAEPLLEQFLAADDFVMDPLLVCGPGQFCPGPLPPGGSQHYVMPFAQVLMRRGMRLNIDSVVAHVGKLFPGDRFSAAQAASAHSLRVNEHRKRVPKFFHDRPRDLILRFPAIIE